MTFNNPELTRTQAHALFNFLSHSQTLYEFSSLKIPGRLSNSGPPFVPSQSVPRQTASPIINTLFRKLALSLPGFRDTQPELWKVHVESILEGMAAQDLSDSYDKGSISKRKIVGYGIVTIAEYAGRGILGGLSKRAPSDREDYNPNDPDDVEEAWTRLLDEMLYGSTVEELVEYVVKTDKLEDLPLRLQAAHRYASLTFATGLHYLFTINPAGPTLMHLLQRILQKVPFGLVRQALKVANAASMINAVLNIFLFHAPTFRGLFGGARGGTLLQSIITSVLGGDKTKLEEQLHLLDGRPDQGSPEQIAAIESYVTNAPREERLEIREQSRTNSASVVSTILARASVSQPATEVIHQSLHLRLKILLSIRDRVRMIDVLCARAGSSASSAPTPDASPRSGTIALPSKTEGDPGITPQDHLSATIREIVRGFDPVLRGLHKSVDLPASLTDLQAFLEELLAISPSTGSSGITGVGVYVKLVEKHQRNLHRFLHALAKNSPEMRGWYLEWYRTCLDLYRDPVASDKVSAEPGGAGAMTETLNELVSGLSSEDKTLVLAEIDEYGAYLQQLETHSRQRLRGVLNGEGADGAGPGAWMAVWQGMVDSTPITPVTMHGPVRYGADDKVHSASARDETLAISDDSEGPGVTRKAQRVREMLGFGKTDVPAMKRTKELLGGKWEEALLLRCMGPGQ